MRSGTCSGWTSARRIHARKARDARQPARDDAGRPGGGGAAARGGGGGAGADHDGRRPRPDAPVRRDRRARRVRQGAGGGVARRPHRRGRPLREGHDLHGHGRPRRGRLPGARGSARRAVRRVGAAPGHADRDGLGAAARAAARARAGAGRSRASAATSTRACRRLASGGSTRSCWPRAGSTGWGSRPRSAGGSSRRRCCRRRVRARSRCRCAAARRRWSRRPATSRRGSGSRQSGRASRSWAAAVLRR